VSTPLTTCTPLNACLNCGYEMDAATATNPAYEMEPPKPGDIAICLKCAHIHAFADDLTVRELTDAEVVEVAGNPDMVRAVEAIGLAAKLSADGWFRPHDLGPEKDPKSGNA
jgi:hypothetical protein